MKLPKPLEARLLFWIWFAVIVLFGIATAADILGNGPQAYIGGLLTGAAYIVASRLLPKQEETPEGNDVQQAPAPDKDNLTAPPHPRDDVIDTQKKSSTPKPRKQGPQRSRSRSQKPEPLSLLDRLRGFSRRF
jgi:hypothetical protein